MNHSWHVPRSTVQRIYAVARWIAPVIATACMSGIAFGWGWLTNRTSIAEVSPMIAEVSLAAKAAQASALHAEEDAKQAKALAIEVARLQLQVWGQSEVIRAYSKSPNLPVYIERARRYYSDAFDEHLDRNPNDPAGAAKRASKLTWRPDRSE